jgi:lysophospholipase L1-like esterase
MNKSCISFILLGLSYHGNTVVKDKPSLLIVGDSTVKKGNGKGVDNLWGWGEPLAQYFDTAKINVENHALGGTSSRTFQTKGLWKAVLDKVKSGDFVLMQFGHNDGSAINDDSRARGTIKGIGEETEEVDNLLTKEHEVVHSYGWYLRKMIRETLAKGATPIVITPIPRDEWENGKIIRSARSYPQWAKEVAAQEKVQLIDLNSSMSDSLDAFGEKKVTGKYFSSHDHTHTSGEGAKLGASLIADGIRVLSDCRLKEYLLKNPKIVLLVSQELEEKK